MKLVDKTEEFVFMRVLNWKVSDHIKLVLNPYVVYFDEEIKVLKSVKNNFFSKQIMIVDTKLLTLMLTPGRLKVVTFWSGSAGMYLKKVFLWKW